MAIQPPKKLVESPLFEKNKSKIIDDIKLLDTVLTGVTFAIASKPDEFPLVDEYGTRTAKSENVSGLSSITIFFKENDDHIVLLDIQEIPE